MLIKQAALERLALLEPRELSAEAKTETCRATRDLRSCGRAVHHVVSTCGHACLCVECLQRTISCPICRTPTGSSGQHQLRLYDECVDAGLIQKNSDLLSEGADVGRLYSFFDVALDNSLVSLICHCILFTSLSCASLLIMSGVRCIKLDCFNFFYNIAIALSATCMLCFHKYGTIASLFCFVLFCYFVILFFVFFLI